MDNFRRNQIKKTYSSLDGTSSSQNAKSGGGVYRPALATDSGMMNRNSLNNFRNTEGFHASKQPTLSLPNQKPHSIPHDGGRNPRRNADGAIDLSLSPAPAKKRIHRKRKKRIIRGVAGVFIAGLLVIGFVLGKGYLGLNKILKGGTQGAAALQENVDPSKLKGEGDGRVNILLLGKGGEGQQAPDLTDTLLIASIDPVQKQAALLSVPRDLWVKPEGMGSMKLNAVYANAKSAAKNKKMSAIDAEKVGLDAIENELQTDLGIPIHYRVMLDFKAFEQAINTVGGIDANIAASETVYEKLFDHSTRKPYVLDVKQGNQQFDGKRALFYARSRYTSPRGDFDRAARQRKIILALKDKVLSLGTFANPVKISQLTDAFGNHVQANLTTQEVLRLYDIGKNIESSSIASVGLADPPNNYVVTDNINGVSIVRPKAGLTDFSEIQSYIRNALKDGFIANENATIAVYNGTNTPGLATKKAAELKSFGYNVSTIADAPTNTYTKNVLVDMRKGQKKYTKHYLEQRLGVTAVSTLPDATIAPGMADFVIILGQGQQ